MSRSLSRLQAIVLGVTVLAGLGLGAVGLVAVGSQQWPLGDTFVIHAGFANVRGVDEGTRVRIQGMDAGEVVQVRRPDQPGADVVLKLRLRGEFRDLLCTDAEAQIQSDNMMGGKVVEILPGKSGERLADNAVLKSRATTELNDLVGEGNDLLQGVKRGKGTLGKLTQDDAAYNELVQLLRESRGTMASVKQDVDAIKALPIIRSYVTDPHRELYRPDQERNRQWFHAKELFEADRAVLTAQGKEKLDRVAPWLEGLKHKGSEVVVASFADRGQDAETARSLTQKQSNAVCDYLTRQHQVEKMGWLSWSRKVTAIGCGNDPPPPDETRDHLPVPRVEILVFVPQK